MFKELSDKLNLPSLEEEVLAYWSKNNTFAKSISQREDAPGFVFYEGPPTANGTPGIHHVISRTIKDLVCRYKTMRGFHVYRKAGWDTQGLPVEIEVEKALGIKSKADILRFGVGKFNAACKESVFKYLKDWEKLTERMGYWLNLDDAYVTYTNEYIESVWWALKKFFDAGLIYRGYKIQPYCPRCETPLSSHEVAQGYRDVKDPSVYIRFKIKSNEEDFKDADFLVWTTTPWTLISNVALAVNPDVEYVKIKTETPLSFGEGGRGVRLLILARERLETIGAEYETLKSFKGAELENVEYERLFDYVPVDKKAFYVTLGDFVTTEDGTGIVHIAPAFGEDDYQVMLKYDLPVIQPVDASGKFTEQVTDFKGRFVKETDDDIIAKLKSEGKLYKKEKYLHPYPHCWRCDTPLLYYARESWYIKTTAYKDRMIELNKQINWCPPETGSGRFGNWLEENRDWALSRDRYWGTPLPIWACSCKECKTPYTAVGSISELKDKALNFREVFPNDQSIDLHKPLIDNIKLKCEACGCELTRVEEVIDAWFDSGSMPFAQYHYPFENKEFFESHFPADFIAEAIDQTRGWFYSLHAIAAALFNDRAYKNLIVNDLILDKEGQKMSKRKGNIVDPFRVMDKFGADILRWYLISSSPPWRPKMFNEDDLLDVRNKFFDTLTNTYRFFVIYSNLAGVTRESVQTGLPPVSEIDRWLLSALNSLKKKYIELMDGYDLTRAARLISDFTIEDLSNWYVRRNRKRFRNPESEADKLSAYQTLYQVLTELVKLISPISPFLADELYRNLTGGESVHLAELGEAVDAEINHELEDEMKLAQRIVYLVRAIRMKHNLKVRQPLRQILVPAKDKTEKARINRMKGIILEEVNIKELNFADEQSGVIVKKAKPNFKVLGPRFGKDIKKLSEAIGNLSGDKLIEIERTGSVSVELDGTTHSISRAEVEILTENIEGWAIETSDNLTVALDTKLDDTLLAEGFAREFINRIQSLRKDRKMQINDRIRIRYKCGDELRTAISSQHDYIENEVLASELTYVQNGGGGSYEHLEINGRKCEVIIEKL
jgi:isoleucyl-tRNA synthetase